MVESSDGAAFGAGLGRGTVTERGDSADIVRSWRGRNRQWGVGDRGFGECWGWEREWVGGGCKVGEVDT